MKKVLLSLTVFVLTISMIVPFVIPTSAATSGTTGDCSWSLNGTVLTISGNGAMADYYASSAPWGKDITKVVIQSGVTAIGENAFNNCRSLTSVTIPNSVITIGYSAFCNCQNLPSVTIGKNVTTIGEDAFRQCLSLISVTIPVGTTTIGDSAFYECRALISAIIPYTVTSIGNNAFYKNSSYTPTTLYVHADSAGRSYAAANSNPYEVTAHTFENNICTVCGASYGSMSGTTGDCNWSLDDTVLTISGNGAMGDYDASDNLAPWGDAITEVIIEDGVTTIGDLAFNQCNSLTSVTIGKNVTTIGDAAFYDTNLHSLTIPDNVIAIGNSAFAWCRNLSEVTIGDGVITIGNNAFFYCCLESVTIGDSVTTIGYSAFSMNESLNYTSVTIPYTITSIGSGAFDSGVTLLVHADSAGYTYAVDNSNPYELTAHTYEDGACTVCGAADPDAAPSLEQTTEGALKLLQYIDGHGVNLTDEIADVSGDGFVTVFDAVRLLQLINEE